MEIIGAYWFLWLILMICGPVLGLILIAIGAMLVSTETTMGILFGIVVGIIGWVSAASTHVWIVLLIIGVAVNLFG